MKAGVKRILLVLVLAIPTIGSCQGEDDIQVSILDTLLISKENKLQVQLKVRNETQQNLLLYGAEDFRSIHIDPEEICRLKEKMSAAFAFFIYDSSLRRIETKFLVPEHIEFTPMTPARLDSIVLTSRLKYLRGSRVIKSFETLIYRAEINLRNYELAKGASYHIRLVYFSGDKVDSMVDPAQIIQDKKMHNARVYRGCSASNKVRIVIN